MSVEMRLAKLTEAQKALQAAKTIPEVKNIIDRAEAIRHFIKQQGYALDVQNDAAELKLRAERKAGQLLRAMEKAKGSAGQGRPSSKGGRTMQPPKTTPTLRELGLTKSQSARWQLTATLPVRIFERHIAAVRSQGDRLTSAHLLREAKKRNRPTFQEPPPLPEGQYQLIYCDAPWQYEHIATAAYASENHYPTLPTDEICALPIDQLAADDCLLYFWATNPKLTEALQVIEAWGFTYRTNMVWVKDRRGMGYYAHQRHELLLIAVKGKPQPPEKAVRPDSVIEHPRLRHSEKPPLVYDLLDTLYPQLRKLELFARPNGQARDLWDYWGNEFQVPKAG